MTMGTDGQLQNLLLQQELKFFSAQLFLWEAPKNGKQKIIERAKAPKVNAGTEPDTDLGPVISKQAKERVHSLVQSGVESGAKLLLDGRNIVVPGYESGNLVEPIILSNITTDMECYKEKSSISNHSGSKSKSSSKVRASEPQVKQTKALEPRDEEEKLVSSSSIRLAEPKSLIFSPDSLQ